MFLTGFSIESFTIIKDKKMKADIILRSSCKVADDPFPQSCLVDLVPTDPHQ